MLPRWLKFAPNYWQFKWLKRNCQQPLMQAILNQRVGVQHSVKDCDILALDFETTGLNIEHDKILSIGYVNIHNGNIDLASAEHMVINANAQLSQQSVKIHHITDSEKDAGIPLSKALEQLLTVMQNKVVLVHFSDIETRFLSQSCVEQYGYKLYFPFIDTFKLGQKQLNKEIGEYHPQKLQLDQLRKRFGLPNYQQHNALSDAIATAELFLAQLEHHHQGKNTPVTAIIQFY